MTQPKHSNLRTHLKREVIVLLDGDLVSELEQGDQDLFADVNEAVRFVIERRRRQRGLRALLDRLDHENGPLDTEEDEHEIQRFMQLLGGSSEENPSS